MGGFGIDRYIKVHIFELLLLPRGAVPGISSDGDDRIEWSQKSRPKVMGS